MDMDYIFQYRPLVRSTGFLVSGKIIFNHINYGDVLIKLKKTSYARGKSCGCNVEYSCD